MCAQKRKEKQPIEGPRGYENWRAAADGRPALSVVEVLLYSDGHVVGEFVKDGVPYDLLNTVPRHTFEFAEALALRMSSHIPPTVPDMSVTDTSRYHGGWLADELASLCSLLMGIRLRPGGVTRDFFGTDPRGRPRADVERPATPLPARHKNGIIPRAFETQDVGSALVPLFESYALLSPLEAISLVRGSRLYQDALWVAEGQPALSWLLFVAALEVVSVHHQESSSSPEQTLKDLKTDLYRDVEQAGGMTLVSKVAKHLERQLGSGKRLMTFVEAFRPAAPPRRDADDLVISWEWPDLEAALKKIYEYRSQALHNGTPFPQPMCGPAIQSGRYVERPDAIASATRDGSWVSEDLPMLLHVFEHLTRGTIVNWWKALSHKRPSDAPSGPHAAHQ